MITARIKAFTRLIGPFPYRPHLIFLFLLAIFISRFTPILASMPPGVHRARSALFIFSLALIPSSLAALLAYLIMKFRKWSDQSLSYYLLEVFGIQMVILYFLQLLTTYIHKHFNDQHPLFLKLNPPVLFFTTLMILISLVVIHRSERSISERLKFANDLVEKLRKDRESLVESDEELRAQVSRILHDRVQSDLMVASMRLQAARGTSLEDIDDAIAKAIEHMEKVRTIDLRLLTQLLTPNFESTSLSAALKSLIAQYSSDTNFQIVIDKAIDDLNSEYLLGIYRIVEQAIINIITHGPSENAVINIRKTKVDSYFIEVTDNGPGSDSQAEGFGTSIIDSWVSILKGEKEIISKPGEGYTLHIRF
jgi:signal transduction histidine kinase